ncbi:Unc-76 [Aphelenchoides fujianensis]|nr:Unc-76 [Aphelenchoides fujianensis]
MDEIADLSLPDAPLAALDDEDSRDSSANEKSPAVARRQPSGTSGAGLGEQLSVSLEDLVGNFDQKVNNVLRDMTETTDNMAPVQVRTEDEIMSESQVWWTLTGNYGNILPLDFNKTHIRRNQIEALGLEDTPRALADEGADCNEDEMDEEELRQSMDLHRMISEHVHLDHEGPPVSADQVIEEIDEMMQASASTCDLMRSMTTDRTAESVDSMYSSMRSPFTASQADAELKLKHYEACSMTADELNALPQSKLLALSAEMEQMILTHNTELVAELARRDELEYEKEVKNKFITLLVNIQDQRRKFNAERKKRGIAKALDLSQLPQFMTATIPFDETRRSVSVVTLESLIKILEAINVNDKQVPTLLTDYILTVVCPSTTTSMIA